MKNAIRTRHVNLMALCIASLLLTTLSCVKEDYFGLSEYARIKAIELANQASAARINNDSLIVYVPFPPGVDLSAVVVRTLTLSSFASSDVVVGDILDMNMSQSMTVVAEDGTSVVWTITPELAGSEPQLPNSDFDLWFMTSAGYLEPGESAASTIWGTGNPGTQLLDIITVTPFEVTDEDLAVRMETKYNGPLPAAFGTPISAASIFVGVFNSDNIDPSDPRAAINFGSPFTGRPSQFRIAYTYSPGEENQDRNEDPLPYKDQCDIYLLLEVRNGESVRRLGTAWFRSDEAVEDFKTIEVDMNYGPLDGSFPDYMKPVDHEFVSADSAEFILPTHLTFVASSSFDGDNFAGAVGSLLFINDLELIYD